MSVRLGERAVDALETLFKANLATELGLIDTERADGLSVPVPAAANYFRRPKSELGGSEAYVEIFEGTIEFDQERFYEGAADGRFVYEVPVTVRATIDNRDNKTSDQMLDIKRRMMVGLAIVIAKNITPWTGDPEIISIVPTELQPYWETDGEDEEKSMRVRATLPLILKMEEFLT